MADFFEATGKNLLSGFTDADGDFVSIHSISTDNVTYSAISSYPHTISFAKGDVRIEDASGANVLVLASNTGNPANGATELIGYIWVYGIDSRGAVSPTPSRVAIEYTGTDGSGPATGYNSSGLVARWAADAGVTTSGSNVISWADTVNGLSLTAVGAPTVGTAPGGTAGSTIVIGPSAGFNGTPTGFPSGAGARTVQMLWKVTGNPFFGGFGYGTNVNGQAFTVSVDSGGEIALDYFGSRVLTGMVATGQWAVTTATYDGTTIRVYIGDVLVASGAATLATGTSVINVCRSFSGVTTEAEIGEILVYSRALPLADVVANNAYLNGRFIGSMTVADPAAATASGIAETSFLATVTTNVAYCFTAWSARTSSTTATDAQVIAGTSAISFGVDAAPGGGIANFSVTGGTASTAYYVNAINYGLAGGKSAVVRSAAITTSATPSVNPVLSSPTATSTGQASFAWTVSTDTGNGTLKTGVMLSTALTPDATQLEAGTDGSGAPLIGGLRTQSITATGPQGGTVSGLNASTSYKVVHFQRDGSNNPSNIVTATVTTDAAGAVTSYTPDSTATTQSGLLTILNNWRTNWNATTPSGKTNSDVRVVQLTQPVASLTIDSQDFSALPGVIVRGIGTYGQLSTFPYYPTSGSHISGTLTLSNSKKVSLYGFTTQGVFLDNNLNMTVKKVSAHTRWSTTRTSPTAVGGFHIYTCPGGLIEQCHVGGFADASFIYYGGNSDLVFEACYGEQFNGDIYKSKQPSSDVSDRIFIRRCMGGRDNLSEIGAHTDWHQAHSGTQNNKVFYGNVHMEGASLNGLPFSGGDFISNSAVWNNPTVQQNSFWMRGQNGLCSSGSGDASFNDLGYCQSGNDGSIQPAGNLPPLFVGTWTTKHDNLGTRMNAGSADTTGTGGVVVTVGDMFSGGIAANMTGYAPYIEGRPATNTYIAAIKPVVGSRRHWAYVGTKVGASDRMREIFLDGNHHGNNGWPTASAFHREYDPSNTLGSGYTGAYDADGGNVTAAPTSLTITEAQLPVYDSDPHGLDVARITFTGTHNQAGAALQLQILDHAASTVLQTVNFTAGTGTAWTATADVPRRWAGYRAKVRSAVNTAVSATQSNQWFSGYIGAPMGQSLANNAFTLGHSTATLNPPAKTLWVLLNDNSGSVSAGPIEVTSSSVLNQRRMAHVIATYCDAPVMLVDMTQDGTSFGDAVDANDTSPARSWFATMYNPVNYVQSRGSDVSIVLWHWFTNEAAVQGEAERFLAPGLIKQVLNGLADNADASGLQPYTSGTVNVTPARAYTPVHFCWDLNGTGQGLFSASRTKFVPFYGGAWYARSSAVADGGFAANDVQKGIYAKGQAAAVHGTALSQISLGTVSGWTGQRGFGGHLAQPAGTHVNDVAGEEDGEALVGVYMAVAFCRAFGVLQAVEPKITQVTDSGTAWVVRMSLPHGGNLSTPYLQMQAGAYAGSFEATNWQTPTLVTEGDLPELHQVQGFAVWTGSTATFRNFTATITNTGTGTGASRYGEVTVTPTGGTSGKTLSFGYADGTHLLTLNDALNSRSYTHWPIETRAHVSGTGYGWPVIRQTGNTTISTTYPL